MNDLVSVLAAMLATSTRSRRALRDGRRLANDRHWIEAIWHKERGATNV